MYRMGAADLFNKLECGGLEMGVFAFDGSTSLRLSPFAGICRGRGYTLELQERLSSYVRGCLEGLQGQK